MSLEEKVLSIVAKNIEKKYEVTLEKEMIADLGTDSLAMLMIIHALEDEFNISINDDDFKDITIVKDIVTKLRARHPNLEDKA